MGRAVYVVSYYKPENLGPRGSTCAKSWWPRRELNRRHTDFQSAALPTELLGRAGASGKKTETRRQGARIIRGKSCCRQEAARLSTRCAAISSAAHNSGVPATKDSPPGARALCAL